MATEPLPMVAVAPTATGHPDPEAPPARSPRVALVNMPWARVDAPSIQCGLLQSVVRAAGHRCDVHYLNLDFAATGLRAAATVDHAGRAVHGDPVTGA